MSRLSITVSERYLALPSGDRADTPVPAQRSSREIGSPRSNLSVKTGGKVRPAMGMSESSQRPTSSSTSDSDGTRSQSPKISKCVKWTLFSIRGKQRAVREAREDEREVKKQQQAVHSQRDLSAMGFVRLTAEFLKCYKSPMPIPPTRPNKDHTFLSPLPSVTSAAQSPARTKLVSLLPRARSRNGLTFTPGSSA